MEFGHNRNKTLEGAITDTDAPADDNAFGENFSIWARRKTGREAHKPHQKRHDRSLFSGVRSREITALRVDISNKAAIDPPEDHADSAQDETDNR